MTLYGEDRFTPAKRAALGLARVLVRAALRHTASLVELELAESSA